MIEVYSEDEALTPEEEAGIRTARGKLGAGRIYLEAQTYARGLYEKLGFRQIGEEFLEDGIPHIPMELI